MRKETKNKILDKRWENIEAETDIRRPQSSEENIQRAKDAHVPESVR